MFRRSPYYWTAGDAAPGVGALVQAESPPTRDSVSAEAPAALAVDVLGASSIRVAQGEQEQVAIEIPAVVDDTIVRRRQEVTLQPVEEVTLPEPVLEQEPDTLESLQDRIDEVQQRREQAATAQEFFALVFEEAFLTLIQAMLMAAQQEAAINRMADIAAGIPVDR